MASTANTCGRRHWLWRLASMATLASGGTAAGLARAATESSAAGFSQKAQALQALHDFGPSLQWSQSILLDMPAVVDDGAFVPITVLAQFNDAQEIRVLVDVNPETLALDVLIPPGTDAFLSTRIRMSASGTVYAAVRTHSGWYFNAQHAQVSTGGCR